MLLIVAVPHHRQTLNLEPKPYISHREMYYLAVMRKWLFLISLSFITSVSFAQRDSITVYYFLAEECVICQQYSPTFNQLHETYNDDYTSFVGLFPNRFSTEEGIAGFKEKYQIAFPLKREFYQTRTKKFGVEITPEVVVYNKTKARIEYQGRIDNLFVRVGKRRRVVTKTELEDVLSALSTGEDIKIKNTTPVGCYINLIK